MRFLVLCFLLLSCTAFQPVNKGGEPPFRQFIKEDLPFLIDFYKKLHQNPEISLQEKETAATLAKELRAIGFEVTENFGGYGIVGIFKNGTGPQILYRTDMDALPMPEKTGLPYASQKTINYNGNETGVMHSCGHDMHMTTWLGTARAMVKMKDQWKGTLMLIGQPAEEIGRGSQLMLDAGLYEKFGVPDFAMGLHSSPEILAGQIGVREGYTMATAESVDIEITGVGAHGASPHRSVDPVVMASMMVMELQTIVSRSVDPLESAVVTVGAIKGGTKHNIIPDKVTLQLTLRTYKDEVRLLVHKRIEEIARGVAIAAGVPDDKMPVVSFPDLYTPSNFNYPEMVNHLKSSAAKAIGEENVIDAMPKMVAEDYSRFGQTSHKVPSVLYWLGTVPEERMNSNEAMPGLHSPFYFPEPDKSIETGVAVNVQTLLDLMNG